MARLSTVIASITVAVAISTTSGGAALADPSATARHQPDPATLHLADERGISIREASRRIAWQRHAYELHIALTPALEPEQYGGMWIGLDDDRIKVGIVHKGAAARAVTTGRIDALARAHRLAEAVDIVPVPHSLVALIEANNWLSGELARANAGAPRPLRAGYVTDRSVVRLGLPTGSEQLTSAQLALVDAATRRLGAMLVTYTYADRVTAEACRFPYCDPPLRAGVELNPHVCTLGFMARSRLDDKPYAFTAGHCVDRNHSRTIYHTDFSNGSRHDIGPRHNYVYGGDGDAAIIQIGDPAKLRPEALVYVAGPVIHNEQYPIRGDSGSTLHMTICKTGVSTDRTSCGRVEELDVTVRYSNGVTVAHLNAATYCSMSGDSGGPVFAANFAYGIHVAGASGCYGYYQDIRRAENLMNVNIMTN